MGTIIFALFAAIWYFARKQRAALDAANAECQLLRDFLSDADLLNDYATWRTEEIAATQAPAPYVPPTPLPHPIMTVARTPRVRSPQPRHSPKAQPTRH